MQTYVDIIDGFGGTAALARALNLPLGTVAAWKSRNSIPSDHWAEIVDAADILDVEGISFEVFAKIKRGRGKLEAA